MKISIEAVLHSLVFAENIFNENEGGVIIERVLSCAYSESVDVRKTTMMCLAEIVRLYFQHTSAYLEQIKECTFNIMAKDEEEVCTLAIEVWCSL
mmetsp:Transcript_40868/g.46906  ORF Transcript_40868/g.46906 Transcript_40868/m.46906 type:complete len:95 (+) Transcript_40868:571-855(+)